MSTTTPPPPSAIRKSSCSILSHATRVAKIKDTPDGHKNDLGFEVKVDIANNINQVLDRLSALHDYDFIFIDWRTLNLNNDGAAQSLRNELKLNAKKLIVVAPCENKALNESLLGFADNTYRGLVDINEKATNSRNYTQCDSLLMGNKCGAHTVPYIKNKNSTSTIEHEATTTKINEEQLYYCNQRGLDQEEAVSLIVNGFCKEVLQQLPMEFAVEAQKLVAISLEGSVG